jgi:hypothetical protein
MVELHFTIDHQYLVVHTLVSSNRFSSKEHRDDIIAFQNYAREISQHCYNFLARRRSPAVFFASGSGEALSHYVTQLEESRVFGVIREQTEAYFAFVQAQWEHNSPLTSQAIYEMTGFNLQKTMVVRLTHPSLRSGRYLGNETVARGHHEDWPNYATVYLWHEILHSYFALDDLSHALIQLITDNELRVQLNHEMTYPPFVGHAALFPFMDNMLPSWRTYLTEAKKSGKGDIQAFQAQ